MSIELNSRSLSLISNSMTPLEWYYKFYSLSGVPAHLLKDQEHFNLYRKPPKEKRLECPKVII
jgi:hypothetical protein